MAKKIRKPVKKSVSVPLGASYLVRKTRGENAIRAKVKSLNAIARLEAVSKRVLVKHLDNPRRDSIKSVKKRRLNEVYYNRDSEICRQRKLRKAEVMAKSGGSGFRVRIARWTPDSFIQCR